MMLDLIYTISIGIVVILSLTAGLVLIKDKSSSPSKLLFVALAASAIGSQIDAIPSQLPPSRFYELVGQLLAIPIWGLCWWFPMSILDENFKIAWKAWSIMLVTSIIPLMYWLTHVHVLPHISLVYWHIHIPLIALVVLHVVWFGISGLKDDTINKRRHARNWIIVVPLVVVVTGIVSEYTVSENMQTVVNSIVILPGVILIFFQVASTDSKIFDMESLATHQAPSPLSLAEKDRPAYEKLLKIMKEEEVYLDANITVGALASILGIPAHSLRAIINQGIGFKNFSTFLASYRIPHIKHALAKIENARVPILTIAYNGGFSSVSTFNRTFRVEVGMTASEYRKKALGMDD